MNNLQEGGFEIICSLCGLLLLSIASIVYRQAVKYSRTKNKKCYWGNHDWHGYVTYHFSGGCSFMEKCKDCNKQREMTSSPLTGYDKKTGKLLKEK